MVQLNLQVTKNDTAAADMPVYNTSVAWLDWPGT